MKMKSFSGFLLVTTTLLAVGCGGSGSKSAGGGGGTPAKGEEILVGEYGSLTGDKATFGVMTKKGIELATDELNAAGGVLGKKVRVLVEDDQGKPEEAANAVQKLVNQERVVAVLGEVASTNSLSAAPICQQGKVPMISPSSTSPKVTATGAWLVR